MNIFHNAPSFVFMILIISFITYSFTDINNYLFNSSLELIETLNTVVDESILRKRVSCLWGPP